ncbi:TVP38/TMEM64 family protein [Pontibaca salina]|uniref:TVP38/TMEM64 family membrane protein n=1 Tax=Pontibaca salina TaxID=2795731 RepID=A0A934HNM4_9RHOB|nr:TVP38/TMEM64 family protein [Pontibaca salina]MBI6630316.1 TVP38/TMEM64 family protein [Pontibaca salina]
MCETSQISKTAVIRYLPLLIIVIIAVIGTLSLREYISFDTLRANREALLGYRDQHFAALVCGFVLVYVAIVAFSLPGAAVTSVAGGFLFGMVPGTVLNVIAATTGACIIFWAARLGLGATLSAKLDATQGAAKKFKARLGENEISVLLLLRLVPAVPFFVANLLPALVGVRFSRFLWTTGLGIIPGAIVYTSIGVGVGEVFDRGETPDLSLIWEPHVIAPILGLCALAALPIVLRMVRGKSEF